MHDTSYDCVKSTVNSFRGCFYRFKYYYEIDEIENMKLTRYEVDENELRKAYSDDPWPLGRVPFSVHRGVFQASLTG